MGRRRNPPLHQNTDRTKNMPRRILFSMRVCDDVKRTNHGAGNDRTRIRTAANASRVKTTLTFLIAKHFLILPGS